MQQQKKVWSVLVVLIIVLLALLGWQRTQQAMLSLPNILSAQLSQAAGTRVAVGKLEVDSWQRLQLTDVTVYDHAEQPVAHSPRLTVSFNLFTLLRGEPPVKAIQTINLAEPEVWLTKRDNGRWNIEDLLEQESSDAKLQARLEWQQGKLHVARGAEQLLFEELAGQAVLAAQQQFTVNLSGRWEATNWQLTVAQLAPERLTADLTADRLPVAQYQRFLPAEEDWQVTAGELQDLMVSAVRESDKWQYQGTVNIHDLAGRWQDVPISGGQGRAVFNQEAVTLFTDARIWDQPLQVRGTIGLQGTAAPLQLQIAAQRFYLAAVPAIKDAGAAGTADFAMAVSGTALKPLVQGEATLTNGSWREFMLPSAKGTFHIFDKQVVVDSLQAELLGGSVQAKGSADWRQGNYQLTVQGQGLALSELMQAWPEANVQGRLAVDAVVSGSRQVPLQAAQGSFVLTQGQVKGIAFDRAESQFSYAPQQLSLPYLNVYWGDAALTLQGTAGPEMLALSVQGAAVPLPALQPLVPELNLQGTARLQGQISGTLQEPAARLTMVASQGGIGGQAFDHASAAVSLTKQQIHVEQAEIIQGTARHSAQGWLTWQPAGRIELKVRSEQARIEPLAMLLLPGEKLTGNLTQEMQISGSLVHPEVQGHVVLTDGSFHGQLIARAEAIYRYTQEVLHLDKALVRSLNTDLELQGQIAADKTMKLTVQANHIDINRLQLDIPYPVKGEARFQGILTGTPQNPVFQGALAAEMLWLNKQALHEVRGTLRVDGPAIDVEDLTFRQGDAAIAMNGGFNQQTREVYGSLDVVNAEVKPIVSILNIPDKGINGWLDGHIRLHGVIGNVNAWITGTLHDGSIKQYPLHSINLDVAFENRVLTIHELTAHEGNGFLAVRGTADLDGRIELEAGGQDMDAGLLTAWLEQDISTAGALRFAAQVSGETKNPQTALSLEVSQGSIGGSRFDSLYGMFQFDKEKIDVNQLLFIKGPYRASAYGTAPWAALTRDNANRVTTANEQMNLKVKLDEADLGILPLLSGWVTAAQGATQGEINITGTLGKPLFEGQFKINDGTMRLATVQDPVEHVKADILFSGNTIRVQTLQGQLGGGLIELTGQAELQGLQPHNYHFELGIYKPMIRSKYFTGPLEGQLSLQSGVKRPLLAGRLYFAEDIIDIPVLPEMGSSQWDLAFDVNIETGKKLRFYNSYLYDMMAEGKVHVGGTLRRPDMNGKLTVTRGTVSYLRTSFKISEASAEWTQVGSFLPAVHLKADTRLQQTRVQLGLDGPADTMQLLLTSEPAMTQQQILTLLTLRSRYYDKQDVNNNGLGKDEMMGILDAGLQMRFISELESNVRNALGLDEFRLVRDTSSDIVKKRYNDKEEATTVNREVYNLEMGKYLTDKLMVNYTMGIDYTKHEIGLRYEMNQQVSVTASIDDQHRTWFGLETRFRF